jgi:hypothetical protein
MTQIGYVAYETKGPVVLKVVNNKIQASSKFKDLMPDDMIILPFPFDNDYSVLATILSVDPNKNRADASNADYIFCLEFDTTEEVWICNGLINKKALTILEYSIENNEPTTNTEGTDKCLPTSINDQVSASS